MIQRAKQLQQLQAYLEQFPVVALIGARQTGKTTLARMLTEECTKGESHLFDLEEARDVDRLADAGFALGELRGLVVLDEIQNRPDLFPVLRTLADRPGRPARFLVLGSASPELLRQSSESLAGRIAYHELRGFHLGEVGSGELQRLWLGGSFPRAFLAGDEAKSAEWRRQFIRTYLERDLASFGIRLAPGAIRRFWTMLAHYHGQTWNGAELARSLAVSEKTVRHYLDTLEKTFMVRCLPPWFENIAKRHVKSPKVYLSDSGILHSLLQVEDRDALLSHPKAGASWEGFAIEQIVQRLGARPEECYFWGLHSGGELDLLVTRGSRRIGFEFKLGSSARVTRSMSSAQKHLALDELIIVHAGSESYPLREAVRSLSLSRVEEDLDPL
ncbi:MAG: ATP-binding protein [Planctomycetota bacterium]